MYVFLMVSCQRLHVTKIIRDVEYNHQAKYILKAKGMFSGCGNIYAEVEEFTKSYRDCV